MPDCACAAHGLAASRNMLCAADVDAIHALARDLPARAVVVDLGAGSGTTALAVLEARDDVQVVSVDADVDAMNWAELAVLTAGHRRRWQRVVALAVIAAIRWDGCPIDLLLHDAGHERDDIDADLRAWLYYLARGTPVWVHDAGVAKGVPKPPNSYPGVRRAIDELVREGWFSDKGHAAGWGWIGRRA